MLDFNFSNITQQINTHEKQIEYTIKAQDSILINNIIGYIMVLSFLSYLLIFKKYSNTRHFNAYDRVLCLFIGLYNALLWVFCGVFYSNMAFLIGVFVVSALNSVLMARVFIDLVNAKDFKLII
jgi:hypothetical protein